ncbi:glycosyltransferase family 2 protein, partial [Salmonella enterica subsp. enterica serovar Stanley]
MPKVSVIIPTYNAKETIERTVDSVLQQTEQDFEIILVDDVSKDNTYAILKSIAAQDRRIFA